MKLRIPQKSDIFGKKVIVRADLDVPLTDQNSIKDDSRLRAVLPTINFLLENNARVILIGHLGRPDPNSKFKIQNSKFSLRPVVDWFNQELGIRNQDLRIEKIGEFEGWKVNDNFCVLENIRFYKEEDLSISSGLEFAKNLASLGEVYVNDAFAVSHRVHASLVGIPKYLPHFAGLRLLKEMEVLSKVLVDPLRPLVVIIGGAKIETKLPLVEKMHKIADYILVGGEIAEQDKILLKVQNEKVTSRKTVLLVADLLENGKDITEKSAENFKQIINLAKTVVWNGPMGITESSKLEDTERGTRILAEALAKRSSYKIVGGGDTVAYLKKVNLLDKFDFVSTGGGAMLDFLSGEKLPGIEALTT
ncbi:MAG: phosphoglycerate kinase [Candidatus Levybacteria bacterium CG_4_10_14_0_2_um_filter_35_8]|nr:MAG: phosphoglycerate kinase [Candidatus Levybacteria bacterium CG22_combo_CG10-13_8_21_14_all_35_11]PJA00598.1 MAG: phosphoglycerate kinase [Candidatus Levybacteria bacterium CG_4_10_14_0_2_um_filter_35_8]PJC54167.1 MAG: phosphoglycerate kinase [Candidatus Levybacteria bacterium CG_4_9_14_0_2_um_filter_35_21]